MRTVFLLADGPVVSVRKSDFLPYEVPSWCEDLGLFWEDDVKSFFLMGFTNLKFAYFDCCYSGRLVINEHNQLVEGKRFQTGFPATEELYSDMSWALGIHEYYFEKKAYQGWYDTIKTALWPLTDYQKWTLVMWERLGAGDTLLQALFKVDGGDWSDPNAPINTYRMKAQWDFLNIKLE